MPALPEIQRRFAAALRGEQAAAASLVHGDGLAPEARLGIYAHNVRLVHAAALALTWPVLKRRVGEAFFDTLAARHMQTGRRSLSGDLHDLGRDFPGWLETELGGTEYAWLTDLARLEWALADAATCAEQRPLPLAALAAVPPEGLAELRLGLVDSFRTIASPWPVYSVWRANQPDGDGRPVDLAAGGEDVLLHVADGVVVLHRVTPGVRRFAEALAARATIAEALDAATLEVTDLADALGLLFREGFIVAVHPPGEATAAPAPPVPGLSISRGDPK